MYGLLADAVLVIHLLFVVFVAVGALLLLKWKWVAWAHLPAALWGAYVEFSGRYCPLTPLENSLRLQAGEAGYAGGFIEHYLTAWIYPDGLTRNIQIAIGLFVTIFNTAMYVYVFHYRPRVQSRRNLSAGAGL